MLLVADKQTTAQKAVATAGKRESDGKIVENKIRDSKFAGEEARRLRFS
jgi:hypothetical protein